MTIFALKRFFFGVSFNMHHEITAVQNTYLTISTLIRFLFGVMFHMRYHFSFFCTALLTMFTVIAFLFGVSSKMQCQRAFINKALWTIFTLIRFLFAWCVFWRALSKRFYQQSSSDNIHTDKVSLLCVFWYALSESFWQKSASCNIQFIRFIFGVYSEVHCQIRPLNEPLVAIFTLIRFLFGVSSKVHYQRVFFEQSSSGNICTDKAFLWCVFWGALSEGFFLTKLFWQSLHWWVFSLVCLLICTVRELLTEKHLLQYSHW